NSTAVNLLSPPVTFSYTAGTGYAKTVAEYLNEVISSSTPSATLGACPTIRRNEWEGANAAGSNPGGPAYAGFQGYTYGPGYWGKTFFVWPPNPDDTANPATPATTTWANATNGSDGGAIRDWRQRFFFKVDGSGNRYRLDDNNVLWNADGTMRPPD